MIIKLGIIGGGNMGTAMISRTFKKYRVTVCEKDAARVGYLKKKFRILSGDFREVVETSDIIILAVKPQDMENVLAQIKPALSSRKLIISIAAGLTTKFFEKHLGRDIRVIRTMPNMPAQIGEGVTALCQGRHATSKDLQAAEKIFSMIGTTVVVEEKLMDSVTAVSGSGPAYVFLFVECFIKAAEKIGLKTDIAKKLVESTLSGSVKLYLQSREPAGDLRVKVTSKGGTTQAALDVFLDNNFQKMFIDAVRAAHTRAGQLAK